MSQVLKKSLTCSKILHIPLEKANSLLLFDKLNDNWEIESCSNIYDAINWLKGGIKYDLILLDFSKTATEFLKLIKLEKTLAKIPVVLLSPTEETELNQKQIDQAKFHGAADIFNYNNLGSSFSIRLHYLVKKFHLISKKREKIIPKSVKPPLGKRLFDIITSFIGLFLLSPLFILIAILIKLDSKGPVLYLSRRVGSGYQIFNLLKFRTMVNDAESAINDLAQLNLYNKSNPELSKNIFNNCLCQSTSCEAPLFMEQGTVCEKYYKLEKQNFSTFMKFQDDPRVTKVGKFLRKTSLDELPQLYNILIGHMSLIGNRPLPLYEAEKLTTDDYISRFAAPAGLTGLWQVEKRNKKFISEEERIQLDIEYAQNYSFLSDLKIAFRTIPAIFQKENY